MNPARLRSAAHRIDFLLLKILGQGISVERLLHDRLYARDVLLVCEALKDPELAELLRLFRSPSPDRPAVTQPPPGRAPRAFQWSADTSGFGVSQPDALEAAPRSPRNGWLTATRRWLHL
jgi:hypothetical protein